VSDWETPPGYRPDPPFGDLTKGTLRTGTRRVLRRVIMFVLRVLFGYRIEGLENVPATGAFILISNHLHNLDPLMTQAALKRNCHFFTKREAYKYPVVRDIARWSGGFPVDRGKPDRWAIRRAEAALEQGLAVGIYPEGTRSTTLGLQKGFAGAGLVALRSGAPIIPSTITGSERMPFNGKKGKLHAGKVWPDPGHEGVLVRFGEPFMIPRELDGKRLGAEAATDLMMIELARMLPPDYRGVYADRVADAPTLPRVQVPSATPE